jgi:multiple sugar transport system ATP-binding protein
MNFVNGRIAVNGRASFVTEGGVTLPLADAPKSSDGQPAIYGIRPEHFIIDASTGVPAEVAVIEPTGSETQVFARMGGQDIVGVFRERISVQPGQTIPLAPDPTQVHLFDKATGRRLN